MDSSSFKTKTIDEFTKELQSAAPVPGGGGASALCGAIGTALGSMVCQVTRLKPKFAGDNDTYLKIINTAETVVEELLGEIDTDANAFSALMAAYRMPKGTDAERQVREKCIQEQLVNATEAPLYTMKLICKAIMLLSDAQKLSSHDVISDVAVGISLCRAALWGAAMNVYINAASMKDAAKRQSYIDEADNMISEYSEIADRVYMTTKAAIVKT